MEGSQLRNIQNIENSLAQLQANISKMSKAESRNQETMARLIENQVPTVQKKLEQSRLARQVQSKQQRQADKAEELRRKNNDSRLINEKEVARGREMLHLVRHHSSTSIKASRKQNQATIQKLKEIELKQKQERMQRVREKEQAAQAKVQLFRQQKQEHLRALRREEVEKNQAKINRLLTSYQALASQQTSMKSKVKETEQDVTTLRKVLRQVQHMKCSEFEGLQQQLGMSGSSNVHALSAAILRNTTKISEN